MRLPQHNLLDDPLGMMAACLAIDWPRTPQSTYERMKADSEAGMLFSEWAGVSRNGYCVDSWMIFIMGQVVDTKYKDLREYLEWCRENEYSPPTYETNEGDGWVKIHKPEPLKIMRITPQ